MSILSISIDELLKIWGELCDARHGRANFGDEAELYAYRFSRHEPRLRFAADPFDTSDPAVAEAGRTRARALHALLTHFSDVYEVAIEVDGRRLGPWLTDEFFLHRCRVRVC